MPVVRSPSAFQLRRGHLAWAHWRHLLCNWNSDHRSSSTYTKSVFQLASLLTFTSNTSHSPLTDREANKSANANVHFSSIHFTTFLYSSLALHSTVTTTRSYLSTLQHCQGYCKVVLLICKPFLRILFNWNLTDWPIRDFCNHESSRKCLILSVLTNILNTL